MELRRKMVFLSQILYPNDTDEVSSNHLKSDMSDYFSRIDDLEPASRAKFINNAWEGSKEKNFHRSTKDKIVKFFYEDDVRTKIWDKITKEEIYKILFVYSFASLIDTFETKDKFESYDYKFIRSYNEYADYNRNDVENLLEYKKTYFYLYRLHSYEQSTMREVLVFNKETNNSLSCIYYRYIPHFIFDKSSNESRHVFAHKGNVLISFRGRVLCIFPPSRSHTPKEQDSGFVTLSLVLGGNVKGGIFTKLSDASFDPASGRFALEEIHDLEKAGTEEINAKTKEKDDEQGIDINDKQSIFRKIRAFGEGTEIYKKYQIALNNKNHTTGKKDNLLLFTPQYQSEVVWSEESDYKNKSLSNKEREDYNFKIKNLEEKLKLSQENNVTEKKVLKSD